MMVEREGRGVLSSRAKAVQPQPMFRILDEAKRVEAMGQKVIHLEIGDTVGFSNEKILDLLRRHVAEPDIRYCPSAGIPELRQVLAETYSHEKGAHFSPSSVVVAPANALITEVLAVCSDEGDSVLIPDPGFPTYALASLFLGLSAERYVLLSGRGWNPDPDEVEERMADPRVRVLMLNIPSNPLGVAMDRGIAERLVEAAKARGIVCVLDETYKNLTYAEDIGRPRHQENMVYLYSFSKDAAIPGFRLGCLVGPDSIASKVADFNSMFFSCMPALLQHVLVDYLRQGGDFHIRMRAEMPSRIHDVVELLQTAPALRFEVPNAAFYIFLDIGASGMDGESFATRLLHESGVCVCPGNAFGPGSQQHVRVTLSGDRQELVDGVRLLVDFFNERVELTQTPKRQVQL
jgi:aspartate/methionine/tyrosine aminotransferase